MGIGGGELGGTMGIASASGTPGGTITDDMFASSLTNSHMTLISQSRVIANPMCILGYIKSPSSTVTMGGASI